MKTAKPFILIFLALILVHVAWLLTFWPGVLGQDSLALLLQIQDGSVKSNKTLFWYLFVKWLYEPQLLVEIPVIVQMLLCALIFARMLAWTWAQRMHKTFFFVLVFIALSPPVLYYDISLYSDGLFSAAVAGLVFEAWLIVRVKRVDALSLFFLALLLPIALFFRANGIFMVLVLLPLLAAVPVVDKLKVSTVFLVWGALFAVANDANENLSQHGSLFPVALFETVNFLQPHPSGLRPLQDHVTRETLTVLERRRPIADILKFYDNDYWDPLVYQAAGPAFLDLTEEDKDTIVREFFCCNLWNNLPDFMGSRVNLFLVSALAQGGFGGPDETVRILPLIKSASTPQPFDVGRLGLFVRDSLMWSFSQRWWLWSPFLGIGLLALVMTGAWRRREWLLLLVVAPLAVQLGGVFFFSIAGEYRYLLFIFTGVAALLPIHVATRKTPGPAVA